MFRFVEVWIAPAASVDDAVAAVAAAAAAAFREWSLKGPGERRKLLMKGAQALEARSADFAAAMATETGASAIWAGFNVNLAADMLLEAASLTTQIDGELIPSDLPGSLSMDVRQPAGVVPGIAPWNAPVILGVRAIAVPLACGNTVVLKGSELCPATHGLIIQALQKAGLPKGVVNFVTNAPQDAAAVVEAMIAHPAAKRVNFTGSTHVGRIVAGTCSRYLKPSILELGGKAPFLVLDDADLDAAVNELIDDALSKGAKLVCGGKAENTLMPATLLDHVTSAMRIFSEEAFGPVKAIVRVNGEDEAIACANDNEFGLSSAVFTRDSVRGWRVAKRIESGICHINGPTVHDEAQIPFGGVKGSGWGRFGGRAGIEAFSETRWITLQTEERHYPF